MGFDGVRCRVARLLLCSHSTTAWASPPPNYKSITLAHFSSGFRRSTVGTQRHAAWASRSPIPRSVRRRQCSTLVAQCSQTDLWVPSHRIGTFSALKYRTALMFVLDLVVTLRQVSSPLYSSTTSPPDSLHLELALRALALLSNLRAGPP